MSEKKLTPFSEVRFMISELKRLEAQRDEIEGAKFFHLLSCEHEEDRVYDDHDVAMTVPAGVLRPALLAIIGAKIKEWGEKLAAIGIGVE